MSAVTGCEGRLPRGQVPLVELIRVEKAHDVRTLRSCVVCEQIGNSDRMIDHGAGWYHGRCFVSALGMKAISGLSRAKQDRLTLGDLGMRLMQALINSRTRK
jgi:hypothetical protein